MSGENYGRPKYPPPHEFKVGDRVVPIGFVEGTQSPRGKELADSLLREGGLTVQQVRPNGDVVTTDKTGEQRVREAGRLLTVPEAQSVMDRGGLPRQVEGQITTRETLGFSRAANTPVPTGVAMQDSGRRFQELPQRDVAVPPALPTAGANTGAPMVWNPPINGGEGGYTFLKRALAENISTGRPVVVGDGSGRMFEYNYAAGQKTMADGMRPLGGSTGYTSATFDHARTTYNVDQGLAELQREGKVTPAAVARAQSGAAQGTGGTTTRTTAAPDSKAPSTAKAVGIGMAIGGAVVAGATYAYKKLTGSNP